MLPARTISPNCNPTAQNNCWYRLGSQRRARCWPLTASCTTTEATAWTCQLPSWTEPCCTQMLPTRFPMCGCKASAAAPTLPATLPTEALEDLRSACTSCRLMLPAFCFSITITHMLHTQTYGSLCADHSPVRSRHKECGKNEGDLHCCRGRLLATRGVQGALVGPQVPSCAICTGIML